MPRRYTDEEVEKRMIREIADAIKPILIPVEQQCVQIQAENMDQIELIAKEVWRMFRDLKEDLGRIK